MESHDHDETLSVTQSTTATKSSRRETRDQTPGTQDKAQAEQQMLDSLTPEEKEKFAKFAKRVKEELIEAALLGEEREHLLEWLDTACYLRYLRAREWDVSASFKMLRKTIEWRNEYKPHRIQRDEVKDVLELGQTYRNGTDQEGRPIMYMKPTMYNPHPWEQRIRGVVYILEKTIKNMRPGVEKIVWILDFTGYSQRQRSENSHKVSNVIMAILQDHYPERLAYCYLVNSPWWMSFAWTLITPFIASATKSKIKWVNGDENSLRPIFTAFIDPAELEIPYGGTRALGPEDARKAKEEKAKEEQVTKLDSSKEEEKKEKEKKRKKKEKEEENKEEKERAQALEEEASSSAKEVVVTKSEPQTASKKKKSRADDHYDI